MASPYCSGPVALYVGVPSTLVLSTGTPGTSGSKGDPVGNPPRPATPGTYLTTVSPVFLGHGEQGPRVHRRKGYAPLMCDLGGVVNPFDELFQGQLAYVFVTLTRWNWQVYEAVSNIVSGSGAVLGDVFGAHGAMMATEGFAFPLWLHFPYGFTTSGHTAYAAAGMPQGLRFYAAKLENDEDFESGTGPNKLHLAFKGLRRYNPNSGAMGLGDTVMTGIPLVPPN